MGENSTMTLDVIAAANGKETIVAGEMAEMDFPKRGGMSLLSAKLLIQVLDLTGPAICEPKQHRALISELNWSHRDLNEIKDAVDELQTTLVRLSVNGPRGAQHRSGQLLTDVHRDEDAAQGELVWKFSDTFRQVLRHSRHWAAISLNAVLAMECKYSVWLYQLVALHAGRREVSRDWPLADLRERLGVRAPSLRTWQDFKRYVLEPSVAEVNHLTGVIVMWKPIKKGRKVVAVKLSCRKKTKEELSSAAAELGRPRDGRKARRENTVESIEAEALALRRQLAADLEATWPKDLLDDDEIKY